MSTLDATQRNSDKKKGKRKKRGKKIRNMLKKMSIYYLNVRDLKSKWTSFQERVSATLNYCTY